MAINHKAAKDFAKRWSGKNWSEDQYARTFWMDLLKSVYDIEYNDTANVIFEHRTSANGKIDLWLRNLSTMVEMKSSDVDLDKPEPRQGEMKTPFKQVYDYAVSFKRQEQPDYLITCNFHEFRVYSRKEYSDNVLEENGQEFTIDQLAEKPEYLAFLIDPKNSRLYHEREISEKAGQLIGKLYDLLRKQYHNPDSEESQHSLNVLCVRLVFCLFCEDAGLFGEMDAFYNFLKDVPAMNIRTNLKRLFKEALDTPRDRRDKYDTAFDVFPYVNGGLFREDVEIPNFTEEIKNFLLQELSQGVDWSKISPTIFGGIFESTLNPETRRKGGMHYTSPENIHKVIDPLFLDDLKAEFESIRDDKELSVIQKRNRYKKFHHKLCSLTFLDPAAGSGNFLTETYICLRQLEFAVISEMNRGKNIGMFDSATEGEIQEHVKLSQFYGIEINDFAVSVAETALWISRLKANQEAIIVYDLDEMKDFPLEERANIICENALRFDWEDLIAPSDLSYIMGNPPFVGYAYQSESQKNDLQLIYDKSKNLDYVAGWYFKAVCYMHNTAIHAAFVSTNSITQGEQVSSVWKPLINEYGLDIEFAVKTFIWDSETILKANVHCVIVGFCVGKSTRKKVLYFNSDCKEYVDNINSYLNPGDYIFVERQNSPISDVPSLNIGNMPIDDGNYLFTEEEMNDFVSKEPRSKGYFHPWYDARGFINQQLRYCLWLGDCTTEELNLMPECLKRVEAVRAFRKNSKRQATLKIADMPTRFATENIPTSTYIAIPEVSSQRRLYIPMGYLSSDYMCSNKLRITTEASLFHFGVLQSSVHMAWMRTVCGRLKSDYDYSIKVVYNTFPWMLPTIEQKSIIEQKAQLILDVRSHYPNNSLADLYDPDKMPEDLKMAHEANDKAVLDAYGFKYDMTEPEIVAELMKLYLELTTR